MGQLFIACTSVETSKHKAVGLKCEHMEDPLGLDTGTPRLSWQMADDTQGARQTAFQVIVGTDQESVRRGEGDAWNSGQVDSDAVLVNYDGTALKPFTRYYWTVRIWNEKERPCEFGDVASFEMGMMNSGNWQAAWISDSEDIDLKPAPWFRKEFTIEKEIASARVYIASAGLHELYINGIKVGDARLTPAYTRFDRRVLYLTHDVTSLLKKRDNAIGVLLGNGWYNHQSTAVWDFHKAPWRAHPKFMLELHLTYEDGTKEVIPTSTAWKTSLSHVVFNSIYTGEHIDNRLYQEGWDRSGFNDQEWTEAVRVESPTDNITAEVMPAIKNVDAIPAKSIRKIDELTYIFDLGRNIAGVSELKVTGERGTILRVKHGEQLLDNGRVDLTGLEVHYRPTDESDPFQTDIYTLSGEGEERFMPHFNYKGFQYVEVTSSKPIVLTKASLTGHFMHSDVEQVGFIVSSDTLLNQIWEATNSSYLSNLFGYPTDCPQREKNGWTGDVHNAVEMGLFNFNSIKVFEKWLDDHRDEQREDGVLPAIIPTDGWGYHWANGPDWTSTIVLLPWFYYLYNGDTRILEENYKSIKLYVDHLSDISPDHLTDWGLGDWVPIKSVSSVELTSSVYFYVDALVLSKISGVLNRKEDADKYLTMAGKVKDAINAKFLDMETGIYASGFQTELSLPLFWGVVPEDMIEKVADNLAKTVKENGTNLDVGLLGSRAILNALSENGYPDMAWQLASKKEFPSWGWWIANGATTLYENWDLDAKDDLSMNHIMFGDIGAWYYKTLGGIQVDENNPGFKHIILKPNFVEGLNDFSASHKGPYGEIVSAWKKIDGVVNYSVTIPANSTATLYLEREVSGPVQPDHKGADMDGLTKISLPAGSYEFTIQSAGNEIDKKRITNR
ncbi:MAG: family 78 glycoside hydrolase catalytic domain [Bacteroidota bacterium]